LVTSKIVERVGSFFWYGDFVANEATAEKLTCPNRFLTWALPGVYESAGSSPADYERHGNNKLNNGQHVFTQEQFTENT
jgi:hypothetical protein